MSALRCLSSAPPEPLELVQDQVRGNGFFALAITLEANIEKHGCNCAAERHHGLSPLVDVGLGAIYGQLPNQTQRPRR